MLVVRASPEVALQPRAAPVAVVVLVALSVLELFSVVVLPAVAVGALLFAAACDVLGALELLAGAGALPPPKWPPPPPPCAPPPLCCANAAPGTSARNTPSAPASITSRDIFTMALLQAMRPISRHLRRTETCYFRDSTSYDARTPALVATYAAHSIIQAHSPPALATNHSRSLHWFRRHDHFRCAVARHRFCDSHTTTVTASGGLPPPLDISALPSKGSRNPPSTPPVNL